MSESLYRYMSFESFGDTVQRKQLHFVHPSEFEDPMEFQYLQKVCVSEPSNYTEEQIKNELSKRLEKFNINANEKSIKISFSHIKNFIKTVLVLPFAPEWYVETVETFCRANDIIFLGKSKLYDLKFLLDE